MAAVNDYDDDHSEAHADSENQPLERCHSLTPAPGRCAQQFTKLKAAQTRTAACRHCRCGSDDCNKLQAHTKQQQFASTPSAEPLELTAVVELAVDELAEVVEPVLCAAVLDDGTCVWPLPEDEAAGEAEPVEESASAKQGRD